MFNSNDDILRVFVKEGVKSRFKNIDIHKKALKGVQA